jgi:hypothetical protein
MKVRNESLDLMTELPRTLCPPNSKLTLVFSADGILIAGEPPKIEYSLPCTQENLGRMGGDRISIPKNIFQMMNKTAKASSEMGMLRSVNLPSLLPFPEAWRLREFYIEGEAEFSVNPYEIEKVRPQGILFRITE